MKTTFLNEDLKKNIYMKESERFYSDQYDSLVYKLKKFIYEKKYTSQW